MKRSRPVALLCLIVYLCTSTGLAQASLLGHFNTATYPSGSFGEKHSAAGHEAEPAHIHEIEPALNLEMASLTQNGLFQGPIEDATTFVLISTTLVTWPVATPVSCGQHCHQSPSPMFRSDPLRQFHTLSLQL